MPTADTKPAEKLGPNATYLNIEGSAKIVTFQGVMFKEGESVNLEEKLGKDRAQAALKKLAGNPHFQVDGGPDRKKEAEAKDEAVDPEVQKHVIAEEARIRREQGDEAADKYVASVDVKTATVKAEKDYKAPDKPTLEKPTQQPAPRRG
jgi:hypothetical protein